MPRREGDGQRRAAIYVRVSTEEQARGGFSLPAQVECCTAYAAAQGWAVAGLFRDEGRSGKDLRRPELQRLLTEVRGGRVDVVLVWRLDRLSRRQADVMHLIQDVLAPAGVGFRSATEPFDTTFAAGLAMVGMLAVFAQLERETIIERTRLGLAQRSAGGLWSGAAPWGYRYGPGGALQPDPELLPWVRRLFELAADPAAGLGAPGIAAWLAGSGVPGPQGRRAWHGSTVAGILANRAYLGERRQGGSWIAAGHEPAVSRDLFDRAGAAVRARRHGGRPRADAGVAYALTGAARCGHCGGPLRGKSQKWPGGARRRYYVCARRLGGRSPDCAFGWQPAEALEGLVGAALRGRPDAGAVARALHALQSEDAAGRESEEARRAVAACDQGLRRLLAAVERGALTAEEVGPRLAELRAERAAAAEAAAAAAAAERQRALAPDLLGLVCDAPRLWVLADGRQRRGLLRALGREVRIWRGGRVELG